MARPPAGPLWLHEIKRDGYRIMAHRDGDNVRLWSRTGKDWTDSLSGIAAGIRALPVASIILDGEAVAIRPDGYDDFHALRSSAGCRSARLIAFDILEMNGQDLRPIFLDGRRVVLSHLLNGLDGSVLMSEIGDGPDGPAMFRAACRLGLEGIISKRRDQPYRSGRSPHWLKSKSPDYARAKGNGAAAPN